METPADGVTQVGYWTMPLAWDVRARASRSWTIVFPRLEGSRRLREGPQFAGDVERADSARRRHAEVVEVKKSDALIAGWIFAASWL